MRKQIWLWVMSGVMVFANVVMADRLSPDNYVISVNSFYGRGEVKAVTETLFTTMYAPLNITPQFRYFPSMRGLQAADRFETDAEAGRVPEVAQQYPNLLAVPEPMIQHEVYWFCTRESQCRWDNEQLYAVPGGFHAARKYCESHQLNCLFEHELPFMASLLSNRAVDALIGNKKLLMNYFCQSDQSRVYYREVPDLHVVSYHLVNVRHQDKIPALAASIKRMHERGDFTRFVAFLDEEPAQCSTAFIALP
ncbi:hypothetical protein [Alteromonas sp. CYL-A6]|uniref:hypothetical protein n=1 Tax=Alteromonas nitratireducens TaxID=3390813 RepID=UPI0034B379A0